MDTDLPPQPTLQEVLAQPLQAPLRTGWRMQALTAFALCMLTLLTLMGAWLTSQPKLPLSLDVSPQGKVVVMHSLYPHLRHLEGRSVQSLQWPSLEDNPSALVAGQLEHVTLDPALLYPSARWMPSAPSRERTLLLHADVHRLLQHRAPDGSLSVVLRSTDGLDERILLSPAGVEGLSPAFWLMAAAAWVVAAAGALVLLGQPSLRNLGFAALTLCQAGHLALMAMEAQLGIFTPPWLVLFEWQARTVFDLVSAAALAHVAITYPVAWPHGRTGLRALWAFTLLSATALVTLRPDGQWWLTQGLCLGLAGVAAAVVWRAQRVSRHAINRIMLRLLLLSMLAWCLLSMALWTGQAHPDLHLALARLGVATWQGHVALMVLLTPWMAQSSTALKEFTLLAASSAIAASLDLLFMTLFSWHAMVASGLSLFLTLGLYLVCRRWLLSRMPRNPGVSTGHIFQRVYQVARRVDAQPQRMCSELQALMVEVFAPLEARLAQGHVPDVMLHDEGARLLVPLNCARHRVEGPPLTLVMVHARRGQALFTSDDVQLVRRILDQLHKALAYDEAMERGRSEERLRIAQDLHDDIGARLLTLMYQAPSRDIEDYIRHTIQDLKTLTRGLATESHTLLAAASEWKRDIDHRLALAHCSLKWEMHVPRDVPLSMVQWSALTRVLRELINNAISHAQATAVCVSLVIDASGLRLSVTDDGVGRNPGSWAHGLGLGGIRKRVKQLGGSVSWREVAPHGICCEVVVTGFPGDEGAVVDAPTELPAPVQASR